MAFWSNLIGKFSNMFGSNPATSADSETGIAKAPTLGIKSELSEPTAAVSFVKEDNGVSGWPDGSKPPSRPPRGGDENVILKEDNSNVPIKGGPDTVVDSKSVFFDPNPFKPLPVSAGEIVQIVDGPKPLPPIQPEKPGEDPIPPKPIFDPLEAFVNVDLDSPKAKAQILAIDPTATGFYEDKSFTVRDITGENFQNQIQTETLSLSFNVADPKGNLQSVQLTEVDELSNYSSKWTGNETTKVYNSSNQMLSDKGLLYGVSGTQMLEFVQNAGVSGFADYDMKGKEVRDSETVFMSQTWNRDSDYQSQVYLPVEPVYALA